MRRAIAAILDALALYWTLAIGPFCWILRDGLGPDSATSHGVQAVGRLLSTFNWGPVLSLLLVTCLVVGPGPVRLALRHFARPRHSAQPRRSMRRRRSGTRRLVALVGVVAGCLAAVDRFGALSVIWGGAAFLAMMIYTLGCFILLRAVKIRRLTLRRSGPTPQAADLWR